MAIRNTQKGFALLIAVIFMSVMLTFGLALGSIGYKQQLLASTAVESQYAFYAADAALECALYADQRQNVFAYSNYNPTSPIGIGISVNCDGLLYPVKTLPESSGKVWVTNTEIALDNNTRCADVTIYKYNTSDPTFSGNSSSYFFSQGYNVSCATVRSPAGARYVSRGLTYVY